MFSRRYILPCASVQVGWNMSFSSVVNEYEPKRRAVSPLASGKSKDRCVLMLKPRSWSFWCKSAIGWVICEARVLTSQPPAAFCWVEKVGFCEAAE